MAVLFLYIITTTFSLILYGLFICFNYFIISFHLQSSLVYIWLNLISVIPTMLIITMFFVPQNQLLIEEHWVVKAWMGNHSLLLWRLKGESTTAPSTGCHHHLHFSVGQICVSLTDAPILILLSVIMLMPAYIPEDFSQALLATISSISNINCVLYGLFFS